MKKNVFFNGISTESTKLLKQLFEHTPIATLILNEAQEIVFINEQVLSYFNDDYDLAYTYLSQLYTGADMEDVSHMHVAHHDIGTFTFTRTIRDACRHKKSISNIQVSYKIKAGNYLTTLWFDVSLVPFECDGHAYVCVKMIDMTKLMKYKIEADTQHMLNDIDNAIEKDRFHENVMTCFKEHCAEDGQAFLIMTELKDTLWIQEKFGFLWKNEHLASFYVHLMTLLGPRDYACRFSENQFLIFVPRVEEKQVQHFISQMDLYHDEHFQLKEVLTHKMLKIKVQHESVKKLVESDQLYKHYFKAISVIEKLKDTETYTILF